MATTPTLNAFDLRNVRELLVERKLHLGPSASAEVSRLDEIHSIQRGDEDDVVDVINIAGGVHRPMPTPLGRWSTLTTKWEGRRLSAYEILVRRSFCSFDEREARLLRKLLSDLMATT